MGRVGAAGGGRRLTTCSSAAPGRAGGGAAAAAARAPGRPRSAPTARCTPCARTRCTPSTGSPAHHLAINTL